MGTASALEYVSDEIPGITRRGRPGAFRYYKGGRRVADAATLDRIKKLVIPPAWTDVWIAPSAKAHLQATGRDKRRRKQYRYHPLFLAARDADKYRHRLEFAAALPRLRRRLAADRRRHGMGRRKVIATVVTLLDETLIRVGNEDYARKNASFGLTTLRNRHVQVKGVALTFLFKGKSGQQWNLAIRDKRVAKIVRSCQELPGQHLFEYQGRQGAVRAVSSSDVNRYLRKVTAKDITAKDFRTWGGTVKAALAFANVEEAPSKAQTRKVVARVAKHLRNTVAVCRKCYIHPALIAAFEKGDFHLRLPARSRELLSPAERATISFLRQAAGRPAHS